MDTVNSNINTLVVTQFYQAFQARRAEEMAAHYHPQAVFSDPVFPQLHGRDIGNMWRMLCQSKDLTISFAIESAESANLNTVIVNWDAWYTFSKTKRKVHNRIQSRLIIENGKIISHQDSFNVWRWSRQALGLTGWLLGWTPFLKRSIQKSASLSLQKFVKRLTGFKSGGSHNGRST